MGRACAKLAYFPQGTTNDYRDIKNKNLNIAAVLACQDDGDYLSALVDPLAAGSGAKPITTHSFGATAMKRWFRASLRRRAGKKVQRQAPSKASAQAGLFRAIGWQQLESRCS